MKTYHVHAFALVRVRIPNIQAKNQKQAIRKATDQLDWYRLFEIAPKDPTASDIEFGEEFSHFLVDEDGDTEFKQSKWYMDSYHDQVSKRMRKAHDCVGSI